MRNSGGSHSSKGKSWNAARVSGTGKEQSIRRFLIRAQAEEEKGSESQGERSSEEEKLEEKGKKEEAKDGQGTSGEQENKEDNGHYVTNGKQEDKYFLKQILIFLNCWLILCDVGQITQWKETHYH